MDGWIKDGWIKDGCIRDESEIGGLRMDYGWIKDASGMNQRWVD